MNIIRGCADYMTWKRIIRNTRSEVVEFLEEFYRQCSDLKRVINNRDSSTVTTTNYEQITGVKVDVNTFEPNHVDLEFIHNLTGYYKLADKNGKRWDELNKILHRRYGVYFHEEVLKEIAVDRLFKEYTINDIDQLITDYEQIPKVTYDEI